MESLVSMKEFMFYNPTRILFGRGYVKDFVGQLKKPGRQILVVMGSGKIKGNPVVKELYNELSEMSVVELTGVEGNPRYDLVDKGVKMCRESEINAILAIGGGSVIDTAKMIAVSVSHMGSCWDIIERKVPISEALPVFCVPTMAGSGTEMNCSCVISNKTTREKRGISSDLMYPQCSIIIPELTYSVSAVDTACGAVDILAHIIDLYYLNHNETLEFMDGVMEEIMQRVVSYALVAVDELDNYEARANLLWASDYALNKFLSNGSKQSALCHAIEHEISAQYDVKHGLGMAVVLPKVLYYCIEDNVEKISKLGYHIFKIEPSGNQVEDAYATVGEMENLFYNKLGLPGIFKNLKISEDELKKMAHRVCRFGDVHGFTTLCSEDIYTIYLQCFGKE